MVFLQKAANIKAGGESIDVTDKVHKGFQKIASEIVKKMPNLFLAGLDIMAEDIEKDPKDQDWRLIEININPGIHMHHFPLHGKGRDVSGVYINSLFKTK